MLRKLLGVGGGGHCRGYDVEQGAVEGGHLRVGEGGAGCGGMDARLVQHLVRHPVAHPADQLRGTHARTHARMNDHGIASHRMRAIHKAKVS